MRVTRERPTNNRSYMFVPLCACFCAYAPTMMFLRHKRKLGRSSLHELAFNRGQREKKKNARLRCNYRDTNTYPYTSLFIIPLHFVVEKKEQLSSVVTISIFFCLVVTNKTADLRRCMNRLHILSYESEIFLNS